MELAARVAELEQLTAAMIDREERMMELKRELRDLRAQLAQRDGGGEGAP